jgi:hypothetical protein
MRRTFLAGVALLPSLLVTVGTFDASPAGACQCVGFTDRQAYDRADVVFVGGVVGYESPRPAVGGTSSSVDPATWRFDVERVYKGAATATQEVVSEVSSASCGLSIPRSGEVLVFADSAGSSGLSPKPSAGQYYAGLCGGTRVIGAAGVPREFGSGYRPSARIPSASTPGGDHVTPPDGDEAGPPAETPHRCLGHARARAWRHGGRRHSGDDGAVASLTCVMNRSARAHHR